MEDGVGRLQELEVVGGFKEVVFSRHNRTDAHELTETETAHTRYAQV